jgi:hypothetical protein
MAAIHKYSEWYKDYRKKNKEKINLRIRAWYKEQRQLWIDIIVGSGVELKCVECGYEKSFAALDFHHVDPATKDHSILFNNYMGKAPTPKRVSSVIGEINKCIVLCSNCHRELHSVYDLNLKNTSKGSG